MILLGNGCADQTQETDTTSRSTQEPDRSTESVCTSPEDTLKEMFPEAEIYGRILYDLDGNGEDDAIILYTLDERSITSGLAVCLSNSNYSGIDLNGIFCSKADLTFENERPVISFDLKIPEREETYVYHVEYSYHKTEKEANFAIVSEPKQERERRKKRACDWNLQQWKSNLSYDQHNNG